MIGTKRLRELKLAKIEQFYDVFIIETYNSQAQDATLKNFAELSLLQQKNFLKYIENSENDRELYILLKNQTIRKQTNIKR